MSDTVNAANEIAQAANVKATTIVVKSTVASGVIVAAEKPEIIEASSEVGKYLATTAFPLAPFLSWTEVFAGIAAVYLLWQFSTSFYDRVIVKIINWSKRNAKHTGQA